MVGIILALYVQHSSNHRPDQNICILSHARLIRCINLRVYYSHIPITHTLKYLATPVKSSCQRARIIKGPEMVKTTALGNPVALGTHGGEMHTAGQEHLSSMHIIASGLAGCSTKWGNLFASYAQFA